MLIGGLGDATALYKPYRRKPGGKLWVSHMCENETEQEALMREFAHLVHGDRGYASYHYHPQRTAEDRQARQAREEREAAEAALVLAGYDGAIVKPFGDPNEAPDCEGVWHGLQLGIEATGLLKQDQIERFMRDRSGSDSTYWSEEEFLQTLEERVGKKDCQLEMKWDKHILVIYEDEGYLKKDVVESYLCDINIRTRYIDEILILTGYDPERLQERGSGRRGVSVVKVKVDKQPSNHFG